MVFPFTCARVIRGRCTLTESSIQWILRGEPSFMYIYSAPAVYYESFPTESHSSLCPDMNE
jgi:hypothetical protein